MKFTMINLHVAYTGEYIAIMGWLLETLTSLINSEVRE